MITQYKHYLNTGNLATYTIFNVGIYARISREDENNINNISESITNQVEFLERIVLENGWNLVEVYKDDGISGTTFDREDFNRMIDDIEGGRINLIITKDLSRLGRDYIKTGYYLENYFPTKQVRYIAVNDGLDTFNEDNNSDFIPFKSVFNDMYAKDISKKVRTALRTKQENGSFLGTVAPFGYNKSPYEKGKLIVDAISSVYVKRIFKDFMAGLSFQCIADQLTQEGIPTPSGYRNIKNTQKRFTGVWNDASVRQILKSEYYIGHTIQNKKKKVNYKLNKQIEIPKSQWIKVENTHEPLINLDDFQLVQKILAKRSYQPKKGQKHLFTGFGFCGHCGSPMAHANQHIKGKYYVVCSTAKLHKNLNLCEAHYLREELLKNCVLTTLRDIAKEYLDTGQLIDELDTEVPDNDLQGKKQAIKEIQNKIEDMKAISMNLYKDKISGIITTEMFQELMAHSNNEREKHINQLETLEKSIQQTGQENNSEEQIKEMLEQFLQFRDIDRTVLSLLVKKIVIYHDSTVDIHFTFRQPVHKDI